MILFFTLIAVVDFIGCLLFNSVVVVSLIILIGFVGVYLIVVV